MAFIQALGELRATVATYAELPLTNNVQGDIRITLDTGAAYTWINASGSGVWADWQKLIVSHYNDLQGAPTSSPLAIDNALLSLRSIYLNLVLAFFKNTILYSYNVLKMVEGMIDNFNTSDGIDLVRSTKQLRVQEPGWPYVNVYDEEVADDWKIKPNLSDLDEYITSLVQGNNLIDGSTLFDTRAKRWYVANGAYKDEVNLLFGYPTYFAAGGNQGLLAQEEIGLTDINGKDFTIDMWAKQAVSGEQTLLHEYTSTAYVDEGASISNFIIKTNSSNKIEVYFRGGTGDGNSISVSTPNTPITITSTTTISTGTWYHIAVQRQNGIFKLFINGILEATSSTSDNTHPFNYNPGDSSNWTRYVLFGFYSNYTLGYMGFNGAITDFRVSIDIARYSSNFTPPTAIYGSPTIPAPATNMSLISNAFEANDVPTSARIIIFEEDALLSITPKVIDTVTVNTDIKAYISRDGGATFTQATLARELDLLSTPSWWLNYSNNIDLLIGTVDLSGQPSGKEIVYKITTHNNKMLYITSVAVNWK